MQFPNENFLKPTPIIDCDHPDILEKSRQLTEGQEDNIEKARSLFYFVRDEIKYNLYATRSLPEHFKASNTLRNKAGYCVQKAVLLTALARAAGIPAGLGFAKLRNNLLNGKALEWLGSNILHFHGYAELHLNGRWVKATPAFDSVLCKKNRIMPVEFDGIQDATFHLRNRDGKLHIEYIEDLGRQYDDLPVERLFDTMRRVFGKNTLEPPER